MKLQAWIGLRSGIVIYLDTHVVVRLYTQTVDGLSATVLQLLEQEDDIRISPMARLEIEYLYEIKRINEQAIAIIDSLESSIGLVTCNAPFGTVSKAAESLNWTRDPFDRLIVAQASLYDALLITKDEKIRLNYNHAIW